MTPALPPAVGPNPAKAKFFAEAAASFELLALYHSLDVKQQKDFHGYVQSLAATVYNRKPVG